MIATNQPALPDLGFDPPLIHAANAPALLNYETSHFTMVRPGLSLYGQDPGQWEAPPGERLTFEPILSLFTQVCFIKHAVPEGTPISYSRRYYTPAPTDIATLPIGYNDGYGTPMSNRAEVLVNGVRCPVVGRVSMDYTTVDVGLVPDAKVGDEITLLGEQNGARITLAEVAEWADCIPYEFLCGIGRRVARVYT